MTEDPLARLVYLHKRAVNLRKLAVLADQDRSAHIVELLGKGARASDLARLLGVTRSRIAQIKAKEEQHG